MVVWRQPILPSISISPSLGFSALYVHFSCESPSRSICCCFFWLMNVDLIWLLFWLFQCPQIPWCLFAPVAFVSPVKLVRCLCDGLSPSSPSQFVHSTDNSEVAGHGMLYLRWGGETPSQTAFRGSEIFSQTFIESTFVFKTVSSTQTLSFSFDTSGLQTPGTTWICHTICSLGTFWFLGLTRVLCTDTSRLQLSTYFGCCGIYISFQGGRIRC